ncbi:hypothetical protein [Acidipropionibacterium timonense]|uniref:hypothetical protein n=1 Tax=Acidipropionibacterium timonense TaxID=2161818 RepID=UPI001032488D|nr:hypothetical protein [Acidipropionibacterium timonense]
MAGVRRVLTALVALTDHRSGEGTCTRAQVADVSGGMSVRWASRCLSILEDLGIITWSRGWLDHGTPRPGIIRISKRTLARLARRAAGYLDPRRATRAAALRRRIQTTLRQPTQHPHRRNPLSLRGELSSPLLPYRESSRAGQAPRHETGDNMTTKLLCIHGGDPTTCPICSSYYQPPRPRRRRGTPTPPPIDIAPINTGTQRTNGTRIVCAICAQPIPTCARAGLRDPHRHHPEPTTVQDTR